MYHIKPVITLERFHIVAYSYAASFSKKRVLIKLTTFFNSKTKAIYLNPLIAYKNELKMSLTSAWTFFKIMLTSAVNLKQRLLHENEIVQLLHNYKCYGVDQSRFRKLLESSAKNVKNNYSKTTPSFLPAVQFVTSLNV